MKQFISRSALLLGAMVMSFAILPQEADAAPRQRCTGAPFSFTNIQTTQYRGGIFVAAGEVTGDSFECSDGSMPTADISEQASMRIAIDPSDPTGNTVMFSGPVQLRIHIESFSWGFKDGQVKGQGSCRGGVCVVDALVQANRIGTDLHGGAKLEMHERMTLDRASHQVTRMEVTNIMVVVGR